MHQYDICVAP